MSDTLTMNIIYVRFSVNIKKADVHIPSAFFSFFGYNPVIC